MSAEPTIEQLPAGGIRIVLELQLDDDGPDAAPAAEPNRATDTVVAAASAVVGGAGKVLGAVWRVVRPDDSAPPADPEE